MGPGMSLLRFLSFLVFLRYDTWVRKYYCYCLRTKKEVLFELEKILQSSPSRLQHHQKSKTEPRNKKIHQETQCPVSSTVRPHCMSCTFILRKISTMLPSHVPSQKEPCTLGHNPESASMSAYATSGGHQSSE